ncbi:MAG: circularly permuted type 2 ATP-grasp protein [Propionibacteriaceae bacterium]|nr:circularly permuted type 2 ATP-grasp protein [Propionibacteriaceae bacterium]
MSVLFEEYAGYPDTFDEVMGPNGAIRDAYSGLTRRFMKMDPEEVRSRAEYLKTQYIDQGVTFDLGGEERPFPLDIIPRVILEHEWAELEVGVAQRVRAIEAFLADVYGEGRVFRDQVIPRKVVVTSPHYHRVMAHYTPPNGVRVQVAGIDLIRDQQGVFRVLEDNVRVPSGVSYVISNRHAMFQAVPEMTNRYRISPVEGYPLQLLAALRNAAPSGVADPVVVVLTPGVYNSAYFEHSLLARMMGVELVEGRDLVCHNGRVSVRTTQGMRPVHVIYRRVDDEFLDPAQFKADSLLGCAGLLTAVRAGNLTIANAVGNGVADDKLVYTYMPDLIRYYLGEEPKLASVQSWRLEEPAHREEVMDRLGELVIKPVDGSGGKGIVIGPRASKEELEKLRAKVLEDPRGWIAQPVVQLSTVPTMIDGKVRPRHVDLRPFAVNKGDEVYVLPGGLTRVALPEGELIVNSSQGGGSKDTWVLSGPKPKREKVNIAALEAIPMVELGEEIILPSHSQQQQQQQDNGERGRHAE